MTHLLYHAVIFLSSLCIGIYLNARAIKRAHFFAGLSKTLAYALSDVANCKS